VSSAARRVLVDEDLPPRLALALAAELGEAIGYSSVRDEGWRGLKNGALLARMVEHGFTILVTADRNMPHQQPLARLNLATVVVTRSPARRRACWRSPKLYRRSRSSETRGVLDRSHLSPPPEHQAEEPGNCARSQRRRKLRPSASLAATTCRTRA